MPIKQNINEEDIWDLINDSSKGLTTLEERFFETIRIMPEKWQISPWGDHNDGFWVIGIIGQVVLWYNDIEEGFNSSSYSKYGRIKEYWCNDDDLAMSIRSLKLYAETGRFHGKAGPPNLSNKRYHIASASVRFERFKPLVKRRKIPKANSKASLDNLRFPE